MKILIAAKQINLSTVRSLLFNRRLLSSSVAEVKKLPIEHYRKSIDDSDYDTVVLHHKEFEKHLSYTLTNNKIVIYSPTGPLNRDYDDVRRIGEATQAGIKKAIQMGSKRPLLVNTVSHETFKMSNQVSLLAALEASYYPLEVREFKKLSSLLKIDRLGFWHDGDAQVAERLIEHANAVELGRIVARDIGGSDPERMCAANVQAYVESIFKSSSEIKLSVVQGQETFLKNYPCFAAVNRAANVTARHQGRIIKLENNPNGKIDRTLFLVGKGLTYDTGGADIKTGGNMISMHRDKCGAAFVAGFFKTLSILKPKGLKVYGTMCMARNSIGEECYVADEILISRAQKRIRVGNTDAEGRLAICDALCEAKELASQDKETSSSVELFTIATLTGHAARAYGTSYSAIMANGPAKREQIDRRIQDAGELIGDPFEISTIRKEDYTNHKGQSEYEDLEQVGIKSANGARGHQGPAAFLIMASGLDKHGVDSQQPLSFAHIDIAGSCGKFPGVPSAVPLPSFFAEYVLPKL